MAWLGVARVFLFWAREDLKFGRARHGVAWLGMAGLGKHISLFRGQKMTAKPTFITIPSPPGDRKYNEMIKSIIVEFLEKLEIGEEFTKEEICKLNDAKDWKDIEYLFRCARKRAESMHGIFIETIHSIGFKRVDHSRGVDMCVNQIKNGFKQVGKGIRRSYHVDQNQIPEQKRNQLTSIQNIQSQQRLWIDLAGG